MVDEFPLCVLLNSGCSAVRCRYPSGEVVGAEDDGSYSVPTKDGTDRETCAESRCQNLQENILQGLDWLSAGASKARDTRIHGFGQFCQRARATA